MSVSLADISLGQSTQPQHKYALWRLREIAFNKINFLGKNGSSNEQSDFDWAANGGSAAPQLLQASVNSGWMLL